MAQSAGTAAAVQTPTGVQTQASAILQPSLDEVRNTLSSLKFDKWKKGSVRDEASDHAASILRDLNTNLPPLLAAADAAPGSASKSMPLMKHLDALYDVLLRVEEASRVSAPSDQIASLQGTLQNLEKARIALDDQLEQVSAAQEKQVTQLQAALQTKSAEAQKTETAAAKPCAPATPVHKNARTKSAAKPAQAKPSASTPAQSPQPQKQQ